MPSVATAERRHLNSLGYVLGGKQSRAFIAWGIDASGARIGIDDAKRGGSQRLLCECGAALVAKKGDIRAHHFAHKAGDVRHCETAAAAAMTKFIEHTLLDARRIDIPETAGRRSHADVLAIRTQIISGHSMQVIDAQLNRTLAVHTRLRRRNIDALTDWCREMNISGIIIDLSAFRNRTDDEIRWAIGSGAPRQWLFRSTKNDHQAKPHVLRRLYGLRA